MSFQYMEVGISMVASATAVQVQERMGTTVRSSFLEVTV